MKMHQHCLFLVLVALGATGTKAQEAKYPPLSEYMMPQAAEGIGEERGATGNLGSRNHQISYRIGLPDRARGG